MAWAQLRGRRKKKDKKRVVAAASRVRVMGQRVRCRGHCLGRTHAVKLLIAMAAVGIGATAAAPSAACRRLAALMELDELAEERRRAVELQAQREKAAAAQKSAAVHTGEVYVPYGILTLVCVPL